MDAYTSEFNKVYPKVKVKFEGLTDYEGEVKIRMKTGELRDVLMIPA
ncbi:sugar ABC transporter substrate-binding protein [Streptomyces badius]